jgi:flavin-binding protein dodecin
MAVEKSIDLTATGATIEAAVEEAIHRATLTLKGLTRFEIEQIEGVIDGGEVSYRVRIRVDFVIKERVHE